MCTRAYIFAWSWKTTLITWIFIQGWYPTSNTSGPPGLKSTIVLNYFLGKTLIFCFVRLNWHFFVQGEILRSWQVWRLTHRARWELKYKTESVHPPPPYPQGRKADKWPSLSMELSLTSCFITKHEDEKNTSIVQI